LSHDSDLIRYRLKLLTSFLTNFGSAPAGPGNFLFLFVDTAACEVTVQQAAAVGRDLPDNRALVSEVVQPRAVDVQICAVEQQQAAMLFSHSPA